MHLAGELYYYSKTCNESLDEIKTNFITVLNASVFFEHCRNVPECQAKYVSVQCGNLTTRRRRDNELSFTHQERATPGMAYIVKFDISVPFDQGDTDTAEAIALNSNILQAMASTIEQEVRSGVFDIHVNGVHLEDDSFSPGYVEFVCPDGMTPKEDSPSCGKMLIINDCDVHVALTRGKPGYR
jgi:hypothetical protein